MMIETEQRNRVAPVDHGDPLAISIVIVTRDREDALPECLRRVLAQEGPPFEVLVVDTSSTAKTQQILNQFPEVVNIRVGDMPYSMVFARNVGLSHARGEIVTYIDDDCFVCPNWLMSLWEEYGDPEVVAVGGRVVHHPWLEPNHDDQVAIVDLGRNIIHTRWNSVPDIAIEVPSLPGGNCSVKRSVALALGGFDTNYVGSAYLEETDFFLRVRNHGGKIMFSPFAVVEHRSFPRPDKIVRSHTNFLFQYSIVRNRIYLQRKYRAPGLVKVLLSQMAHIIVMTLGMLRQALIFFVASLAGIIAGLFSPRMGGNKGLAAPAPPSEQHSERELDVPGAMT